MSTLAFVLFWVVVAIALVFIGLSGGPRGARERLHTQSRGGQKLSYAAFAVALLALGVAIPGLVIAAVRDRDSIPEAGVTELTAQEERGRELFAEQCRQCHTLAAAAAAATVGPNLDELRPTYGLTLDAIEQGRARGNGAMAADLVVGEDAEAVAAFVAKAVGRADTIGAATPQGGEAEAESGQNPVEGDEAESGDDEATSGDDAAGDEATSGDDAAGGE